MQAIIDILDGLCKTAHPDGELAWAYQDNVMRLFTVEGENTVAVHKAVSLEDGIYWGLEYLKDAYENQQIADLEDFMQGNH